MGLVAIYVDPDDGDVRHVVAVKDDGKVRDHVQRDKRRCELVRVREERPGDFPPSDDED